MIEIAWAVRYNLASEATGLSCWWTTPDGVQHSHHEDWDQPATEAEVTSMLQTIGRAIVPLCLR